MNCRLNRWLLWESSNSRTFWLLPRRILSLRNLTKSSPYSANNCWETQGKPLSQNWYTTVASSCSISITIKGVLGLKKQVRHWSHLMITHVSVASMVKKSCLPLGNTLDCWWSPAMWPRSFLVVFVWSKWCPSIDLGIPVLVEILSRVHLASPGEQSHFEWLQWIISLSHMSFTLYIFRWRPVQVWREFNHPWRH